MKKNFISSLLEEYEFINVYEIGSKGGAFSDLKKYEKYVDYIGFEANEDECNLLNKSACKNKRFYKETYYPKAVGGHIERPTFHITNQPGCSSFLEPNHEMLEFFGRNKWFNTKNTKEIKTSTLLELKKELNLKNPDFLKIDVEGMDLEVLKGLGKDIDGILGLRMEINYLDHRKEQSSIGDIFSFLQKKGFYVFGFLENNSWRTDSLMGDQYFKFFDINFSKGQLAHGDILAFKNPIDLTFSSKFSLSSKIKYAALLDSYGFISHVKMVTESPDFQKIFSKKQMIINRKYLVQSSRYLFFSRILDLITDFFSYLKTNLIIIIKRK